MAPPGLFCQVCLVGCPSIGNYKKHLRSKEHQQKKAELFQKEVFRGHVYLNHIDILGDRRPKYPLLGLSLVTLCSGSEVGSLFYLCHACEEPLSDISEHLDSPEHCRNYYNYSNPDVLRFSWIPSPKINHIVDPMAHSKVKKNWERHTGKLQALDLPPDLFETVRGATYVKAMATLSENDNLLKQTTAARPKRMTIQTYLATPNRKHPLLGLEHLVECSCEEQTDRHLYLCTACQIILTDRKIIKHLLSFDHIRRYINVWHPSTLLSSYDYTSAFRDMMQHFAKRMEEIHATTIADMKQVVLRPALLFSSVEGATYAKALEMLEYWRKLHKESSVITSITPGEKLATAEPPGGEMTAQHPTHTEPPTAVSKLEEVKHPVMFCGLRCQVCCVKFEAASQYFAHLQKLEHMQKMKTIFVTEDEPLTPKKVFYSSILKECQYIKRQRAEPVIGLLHIVMCISTQAYCKPLCICMVCQYVFPDSEFRTHLNHPRHIKQTLLHQNPARLRFAWKGKECKEELTSLAWEEENARGPEHMIIKIIDLPSWMILGMRRLSQTDTKYEHACKTLDEYFSFDWTSEVPKMVTIDELQSSLTYPQLGLPFLVRFKSVTEPWRSLCLLCERNLEEVEFSCHVFSFEHVKAFLNYAHPGSLDCEAKETPDIMLDLAKQAAEIHPTCSIQIATLSIDVCPNKYGTAVTTLLRRKKMAGEGRLIPVLPAGQKLVPTEPLKKADGFGSDTSSEMTKIPAEKGHPDVNNRTPQRPDANDCTPRRPGVIHRNPWRPDVKDHTPQPIPVEKAAVSVEDSRVHKPDEKKCPTRNTSVERRADTGPSVDRETRKQSTEEQKTEKDQATGSAVMLTGGRQSSESQETARKRKRDAVEEAGTKRGATGKDETARVGRDLSAELGSGTPKKSQRREHTGPEVGGKRKRLNDVDRRLTCEKTQKYRVDDLPLPPDIPQLDSEIEYMMELLDPTMLRRAPPSTSDCQPRANALISDVQDKPYSADLQQPAVQPPTSRCHPQVTPEDIVDPTSKNTALWCYLNNAERTEPVIGVSMMTEYQWPVAHHARNYFRCHCCKIDVQYGCSPVTSHLTSAEHRYNYIKDLRPRMVDDWPSTEHPNDRTKELRDLAQQVERDEGYGTFREKEMRLSKSQSLKAAAKRPLKTDGTSKTTDTSLKMNVTSKSVAEFTELSSSCPTEDTAKTVSKGNVVTATCHAAAKRTTTSDVLATNSKLYISFKTTATTSKPAAPSRAATISSATSAISKSTGAKSHLTQTNTKPTAHISSATPAKSKSKSIATISKCTTSTTTSKPSTAVCHSAAVMYSSTATFSNTTPAIPKSSKSVATISKPTSGQALAPQDSVQQQGISQDSREWQQVNQDPGTRQEAPQFSGTRPRPPQYSRSLSLPSTGAASKTMSTSGAATTCPTVARTRDTAVTPKNKVPSKAAETTLKTATNQQVKMSVTGTKTHTTSTTCQTTKDASKTGRIQCSACVRSNSDDTTQKRDTQLLFSILTAVSPTSTCGSSPAETRRSESSIYGPAVGLNFMVAITHDEKRCALFCLLCKTRPASYRHRFSTEHRSNYVRFKCPELTSDLSDMELLNMATELAKEDTGGRTQTLPMNSEREYEELTKAEVPEVLIKIKAILRQQRGSQDSPSATDPQPESLKHQHMLTGLHEPSHHPDGNETNQSPARLATGSECSPMHTIPTATQTEGPQSCDVHLESSQEPRMQAVAPQDSVQQGISQDSREWQQVNQDPGTRQEAPQFSGTRPRPPQYSRSLSLPGIMTDSRLSCYLKVMSEADRKRVVGLRSMLECQCGETSQRETVFPSYTCRSCQCTVHLQHICEHITSFKHQFNYMWEKCPNIMAGIWNLEDMSEEQKMKGFELAVNVVAEREQFEDKVLDMNSCDRVQAASFNEGIYILEDISRQQNLTSSSCPPADQQPPEATDDKESVRLPKSLTETTPISEAVVKTEPVPEPLTTLNAHSSNVTEAMDDKESIRLTKILTETTPTSEAVVKTEPVPEPLTILNNSNVTVIIKQEDETYSCSSGHTELRQTAKRVLDDVSSNGDEETVKRMRVSMSPDGGSAHGSPSGPYSDISSPGSQCSSPQNEEAKVKVETTSVPALDEPSQMRPRPKLVQILNSLKTLVSSDFNLECSPTKPVSAASTKPSTTPWFIDSSPAEREPLLHLHSTPPEVKQASPPLALTSVTSVNAVPVTPPANKDLPSSEPTTSIFDMNFRQLASLVRAKQLGEDVSPSRARPKNDTEIVSMTSTSTQPSVGRVKPRMQSDSKCRIPTLCIKPNQSVGALKWQLAAPKPADSDICDHQSLESHYRAAKPAGEDSHVASNPPAARAVSSTELQPRRNQTVQLYCNLGISVGEPSATPATVINPNTAQALQASIYNTMVSPFNIVVGPYMGGPVTVVNPNPTNQQFTGSDYSINRPTVSMVNPSGSLPTAGYGTPVYPYSQVTQNPHFAHGYPSGTVAQNSYFTHEYLHGREPAGISRAPDQHSVFSQNVNYSDGSTGGLLYPIQTPPQQWTGQDVISGGTYATNLTAEALLDMQRQQQPQ